MTITIGCTTRPLADLAFAEKCRVIADAGYSDVALFFDVGIDADSPAEHTVAVREAALAAGLRPSMLIARVELQQGIAEAAVRYRRVVDHARALGARWLLDMGAPDPELLADYTAVMKLAAPYAHRAGVGIGLKPHGGLTLSSDDLITAHEAVGHPAFGISYDAGNIIYYSKGAERPESGVRQVAPLVTTFMVKDCVVRDGQPDVLINPGDGWVDFGLVLRELAAGGFGGPMYVECVAGATPQEIIPNIRRAREFMLGVLAEVGLDDE